jgi:hypothetical protein
LVRRCAEANGVIAMNTVTVRLMLVGIRKARLTEVVVYSHSSDVMSAAKLRR